MPTKLDYTAIDAAIQADPELSSRELCEKYGFECSLNSICKRKQLLGISPAMRGRKVDDADRGLSSSMKNLLCRCPKCGSNHMMPIFWTGRGQPRIFCPDCRNHPSREDWESMTPEYYGHSAIQMLHRQYM